MRIQRSPVRPWAILLALLVTSLYISTTEAQGNLPTLTDTAATTANTATTPQTGTTTGGTATGGTTTGATTNTAATTNPTDKASSDTNTGTTTAPLSNTNKKATITPTAGSGSTSSEGPPPSITSSINTATDGSAPTGLPKLSGAFSYPAPSVPPTQNAPYMQKSNLPEGTVFIAVGACLGALGIAVLAWRGLVAWSLHRSVKRAALQQSVTDSKSPFRPGPGATANGPGFYQAHAGSTMSLDALSNTNRNSVAGTKHHTPNGSLFFSPTASGNMNTPGNRGSGHLPAGYYQSGASTPGNGTGMTHLGGATTNPLARLGPQGHGYMRPVSGHAPSPPISPNLPPQRGLAGGYHTSNSSLNLTQPPQGRAPSAYLEDLFEGRG